jgi:hypothetical protein
MIIKNRILNYLHFICSILCFCITISIILISCNSFNTTEYTKCEESCEYSRRDCIEACGGYNTFGFSYDFGRSEIESPYACSDKCEVRAKRCFELCKDKDRLK